jgi:hypothetical protein
MGFGKLNDNMIKRTNMFVKELLSSNLFVNQVIVLAHVIYNQIKEYIEERQAICKKK